MNTQGGRLPFRRLISNLFTCSGVSSRLGGGLEGGVLGLVLEPSLNSAIITTNLDCFVRLDALYVYKEERW